MSNRAFRKSSSGRSERELTSARFLRWQAERSVDRNESNDEGGREMSRETADEAVDHYSRKRDHSLTERGNSEIMGVRKFHNWIKRTLIREYCPYGGDMVTVLDICGGKGGDFHKWAEEANVGHVVLIDAARGSIDDALERYREFHWNKNQWHFGVTFVCADCFGADLHAILPPHLSFDFASCQFALQYAFSSEERIRGLLRNVSIRLKPGCSFIGTIPDAEFLIKKLKESPSPSFGNDLYHVTFPAKIDGRFADFGSSYRFYLREAVDDVLECKDQSSSHGLR